MLPKFKGRRRSSEISKESRGSALPFSGGSFTIIVGWLVLRRKLETKSEGSRLIPDGFTEKVGLERRITLRFSWCTSSRREEGGGKEGKVFKGWRKGKEEWEG